ncbi:hypothetical protein MM213_12800 [Belliella sp. R4-6]|uniref:Uncharacterized protein n=1 Tax=Belliella alkalica TaxID=1730871 RepID=A0ABS9VEK9_9BACT|nr:hypothetical protein [Belliella alkalica]MCH7414370.1 hypothetical protein [Belliella alkalica]
MFLQHPPGYSSYIKEATYAPSLFLDIREWLSLELIAEMNEKIHGFSMERSSANPDIDKKDNCPTGGEGVKHKDELIFCASISP